MMAALIKADETFKSDRKEDAAKSLDAFPCVMPLGSFPGSRPQASSSLRVSNLMHERTNGRSNACQRRHGQRWCPRTFGTPAQLTFSFLRKPLTLTALLASSGVSVACSCSLFAGRAMYAEATTVARGKVRSRELSRTPNSANVDTQKLRRVANCLRCCREVSTRFFAFRVFRTPRLLYSWRLHNLLGYYCVPGALGLLTMTSAITFSVTSAFCFYRTSEIGVTWPLRSAHFEI